MQQEHDADQRHDDAFLDERALERLDRGLDQLGTVVDGNDLGAFRQAGRDLRQPRLDVVDDGQRIRAVTLEGDGARHLAVAVQFGDAAALVGAEFDPGDVLHPQRCPGIGLQHDVFDVFDAPEVAAAAHDEFEFGHLDRAAADVDVARTDRIAEFLQRDALCPEAARVDDHVVLFDEAADGSDFGDALRLRDRVPDRPVLQRPQLGQGHFLGNDGVLVDPAHAGGVRSQGRRDPGRQFARGRVQEFEHPAPGPVRIGAVLENHVDEGNPEERKAAHDLGLRHREHRRRQRIGDLILHDLRRLPRVLGVDDHLHVREIGNGIERKRAYRVDPCGNGKHRADDDQQQVVRGPRDQPRNHFGCSPSVKARKAAFRLLSASIRKLAETTILSPSEIPSVISV